MYPAPFDYSAPQTLDEAIALLAQHGEGAKVLAGGHSLLPLLKLRFVQPTHLVDIGKIAALRGIRREGDTLVIGAMTTHATIAASTEIHDHLPVLAEAAAEIGDPQVRNRGTIGGSIAHADPGADLPAVMLATDAQMTVASSNGRRVISASDFFVGMLTSALATGEVLTEVRIPLPPGKAGSAYSKHPHPASRYAIVGVAATVVLDASGTISSARVGVTGLGTRPVRATATEQLLVGKQADEATIRAAAARVAVGIEPRDDLQGSAEFKAHLASVHAERALVRAIERAK